MTAACLAQHDQPRPKVDVHIDPEALQAGAGLWQQASPEMKAAAVKALRKQLQDVRQPIAQHMRELVERREQAASQRIDDAMDEVARLGVLLLLIPVLFARRYPGRFYTLVWQSIVAAGWFFVTVHLFAVPLVMFFSFTMHVTEQLDPRFYAVDPVFDVLDDNAAAVLSHDLPVGPTLDEMAAGNVNSFLTLLLENLIELREQAEVFRPLLNVLKWLQDLTGPLLHVETVLVIVPFLWSIWPVFAAIVKFPLRAAAGEQGSLRRVLKQTLRDWWREVLSVLALLPLFVALVLLLEVVLDTLSRTGTQALLEYIVLTLEYLARDPSPSFAVIYFVLGCLAFFSAFTAGAIVLASWCYLTQMLRVLRLRCHEKVPLRAYRRFWWQATLAVVWVLVLPLLFVLLIVPGIRHLFLMLAHSSPPHYLAGQLSAGFLLVAGILVIFRVARGFRALRFLWTEPIPLAKIHELPAAEPAPTLTAD